MFKILFMFFTFCKELITDQKEEFNITSTKFSFKRSINLLIIIISVLLNYFLINRLIHISEKYFTLEVKVIDLEDFKKHHLENDSVITYLQTSDGVCIKLTPPSKKTP